MANQKQVTKLVTVDTLIPTQAVTSFEKLILAKYGFLASVKANKIKDEKLKSSFFFYVEDMIAPEILAIKNTIYEYAASGDSLAIQMSDFLRDKQVEIEAEVDLEESIAAKFTWQKVFQHILSKPECHQLEDILVTGISFSPNNGNPVIPFHPGQTKGWIYRITRDGVNGDSLMTAYHRIKAEVDSDFYTSLQIVLELSKANSLNGKRAGSNPKQSAAIENITEYLSRYPLSEN